MPEGCADGREPPPPAAPAPPRASPARAEGADLPTELLTWPGCLLDFQALPPPCAPALAPRLTLPVLMLPVLMFVLRLTLMVLLPPP